jgi:DNA-directed RNA polymerase subunit RPC12/RpoP
MELTGSSESGTEEWFCPRCSRRLLLRWRPAFEKLVLDRGDERVRHAGTKGAVGFGAVEVRPADLPALPDGQARWLAENGIDWNSSAPGSTDR